MGLTEFKQSIYRGYERAAHLDKLDEALTGLSRYAETEGAEGVGRLIVEMPPRHGKTVTVSRLFPVWHLGKCPAHRVILVSYAADLSVRNSRAARGYLDGLRFRSIFPGVLLSAESRSVQAWDIARYGGGMDAIGMLGAATGKGANLLLIDDPVKSRQEAESDVVRERIWDAFNDDLMTRLEPGGACVVLMTRWHTDDLIGRILKHQQEGWLRLRLPALAEENDPLGRQVGEALWPSRFTESTLRETERKLGPYSFAALYQQSPVSAEGGLFKRAWFYPLVKEPPMILRTIRYWDLAMSEKTHADYTVGVKIGQGADGHFYVLDVVRRQIDWGNLVGWMAMVMLEDGEDCAQGVEQQGYMSKAIQDLNLDARLRLHRIMGYTKHRDKVTAALPLAARLADTTKVIHVLDRSWTPTFVDELCAFPYGANDDQVDAAAGAYDMISVGQAIGGLTIQESRISEW